MGEVYDLNEARDRAFKSYEKDREEEYGRDLDKADWNRMEADIERLTKERNEARRIVTYIRDTLMCNGYSKCKRCELTAIIRSWGDE